jgi:hypothetical protein
MKNPAKRRGFFCNKKGRAFARPQSLPDTQRGVIESGSVQGFLGGEIFITEVTGNSLVSNVP